MRVTTGMLLRALHASKDWYEIDLPEIRRLSDRDGEDMLSAGEIPERPEWTDSFLITP